MVTLQASRLLPCWVQAAAPRATNRTGRNHHERVHPCPGGGDTARRRQCTARYVERNACVVLADLQHDVLSRTGWPWAGITTICAAHPDRVGRGPDDALQFRPSAFGTSTCTRPGDAQASGGAHAPPVDPSDNAYNRLPRRESCHTSAPPAPSLRERPRDLHRPGGTQPRLHREQRLATDPQARHRRPRTRPGPRGDLHRTVRNDECHHGRRNHHRHSRRCTHRSRAPTIRNVHPQ
jgi:hypothetical protein